MPELEAITAEAQRRGDTFEYTFPAPTGWTWAQFTGGVFFTLREEIPASTVLDDDDAVAVASTADGRVTFDGDTGTVLIPASETKTWPQKRLYFDIEGRITDGAKVHTILIGRLPMLPDITRRS